MTTTETVSKTKGALPTLITPEGPVVVNESPASPKTHTNWRILEQAGFIPVSIKCDGYLGNHPADMTCHSNVIPAAKNILGHMDPNHGGGWFKVKFRVSDGKQSPVWGELEAAGVELQHFYCGHCREDVPMSPRKIIYHLNPHPGANRINMNPQTLCMTLGFQRLDEDEFSDLYEG